MIDEDFLGCSIEVRDSEGEFRTGTIVAVHPFGWFSVQADETGELIELQDRT